MVSGFEVNKGESSSDFDRKTAIWILPFYHGHGPVGAFWGRVYGGRGPIADR